MMMIMLIIPNVFAPTGNAINTCLELQNMSSDVADDYYLAQDIDCSATGSWNGGRGFLPVGNNTDWFDTMFTGNFDGQNFSIDDLFINSTASPAGIFGFIYNVNIDNVVLNRVNISGHSNVGGLVGYIYYTSNIDNSYVSGNISGGSDVGGLVGKADPMFSGQKTISNSGANVTVTGIYNVGGLIGASSYTTIVNSYANGKINGSGSVGGLIGIASEYDNIDNSSATGDVNGVSTVGGLAGSMDYGTIANS